MHVCGPQQARKRQATLGGTISSLDEFHMKLDNNAGQSNMGCDSKEHISDEPSAVQ